jgi:hypothetical protein
VRAVVVVPGPTDTGQTRPEAGPHTDEAARTIVESTIVGRRATVEEIANVYDRETPPTDLPVRHSRDGFRHAPGEEPGA